MRRTLILMTLLMAPLAPVAAQDSAAARAEYFGAVARFFNLPPREIAILGEWEIPADEIPVVLFMARRSGVSPEALVALRDAGQPWTALARRYRVGPAALHVPVPDDARVGTLADAYVAYRGTPVNEWHNLRLSERDIIGLVNVRVISQTLGLPAERVLARTDSVGSFVELYAHFRR